MRKVVRALPLVALCFATAGLGRAAWAWESRDFRHGREHCGGSYGDTFNCQSRTNAGGATTSPPARRGGTPSSYSGGATTGNFDYITAQAAWTSSLPAQTLPASLYLKAKPSFFGDDQWPWVDPTGSAKLYTLPAKARLDAGTPFALAPGATQ